MPTVHRVGRYAIRVQWREHGVPHVHVHSPDDDCVIRIDNGEVLAGELRGPQMMEVLRWIEGHRELLLEVWRRR